MSSLHPAIESAIGEATGAPFRIASASALGGGCIHHAECLTGADGRRFFVKQNSRDLLPSFAAEAEALAAMAATRTIRVPLPVATCHAAGKAALILEYLPISRARDGDWEAMGRQLARLHRHTADSFGWPSDNFIGPTPQHNTRHTDWITFYAECRLRPQITWARRKGLPLRQADALLDALPRLFAGYTPVPSLLHGDLWAGNAAFLEDRSPVTFDPAAYFGDREADLAMTSLFGGFPPPFYHAYHAEWPLHPDHPSRQSLYHLYHLLNHFILFGGSYGQQAEKGVRSII